MIVRDGGAKVAPAADGLLVARGKLELADTLWLHAAPPSLRVEVRDADGHRLAFGDRLELSGERRPMTLLRRAGDRITREDRWPVDDDLGALVILPGGEVGHLRAWWNRKDGGEWRWSVEFYNRR